MLLVTTSIPAAGAIITYNVVLSGAQSVPANVTTAFGNATVTVDDVLNSVSVVLNFSGLTGGNAGAAHIHCCSLTTATAPVVIPFTGFPSATSGNYSNTFTGVSLTNINGIKAGLAYINIHDATFPAGEIRGNIVTPEPATLSLMGLGLLALIGARAKRNRHAAR